MSYISSLNLLGADSPADISEEALREELSLWANAQFTFDTEPGSALLDDFNGGDATKPSSTTTTPSVDQNHTDLLVALAGFGQQQDQTAATTDLQKELVNSYINYPLLQPPFQQQQQEAPTVTEPSAPRALPRLAPAPTPGGLVSNPTAWPATPTASSTTSTSSSSSRKRKQPSTNASSAMDPSEAERLAAEEDKRRRNTAASARFRMKKKLREQALERTAKEMTRKAEALEKRVKELEMEAKWLRALVIEKDPKLLNLVSSTSSTED